LVDQRYELLAEVGRGASGSVHRARDITTGEIVAIKVVKLENPTELGRFERESSLLATVRHPNIVAYIAHGDTGGGNHFLVEEWVDGGTLRKRIREAPGVTARDGIAVGIGIARALAAAHAHDIVHRDVKPENVLVAGSDLTTVKLADFGIARLTDPEVRLTRTGVMLGTPAYMSPEQARGSSEIGPAADVWALGSVMFEMLGGRTPFTGQTAASVRAKVILEDPPDLAILCPEAPPDVVALIERMLTKDPAGRPANGAAVIEAIARLSPVPDGPRRKSGGVETRTKAMSKRRLHELARRQGEENAITSVMFVAAVEEGADTITDHGRTLAGLADEFQLELNQLDDGAAFLVSRRSNKDGAMDTARAACALAQLPSMAISIVGHAFLEREDALDRGAAELEQSSIEAVFAGSSRVYLDPLITDLVGPDVLEAIAVARRR
jgi:eukaryotic-like serine/threonine-protein kinase